LCTDPFVINAPPRASLLPKLAKFELRVTAAGGRAAAIANWKAQQKAKKVRERRVCLV
jgi:hypothetical protein